MSIKGMMNLSKSERMELQRQASKNVEMRNIAREWCRNESSPGEFGSDEVLSQSPREFGAPTCRHTLPPHFGEVSRSQVGNVLGLLRSRLTGDVRKHLLVSSNVKRKILGDGDRESSRLVSMLFSL